MLIVWGRRVTRRKMGYVADFCGMCRGPRGFLVERIGSAGHVFFLSVGQGRLVGFRRTCEECRTAFAAKPEAYVSMARKSVAFEELKRQTFPKLDEVLRDRLALEERIRTSPASVKSQERYSLIKEAFLVMSPEVESRFAQTHMDMGIILALIAAIALVIGGAPLVGGVWADAPSWALAVPAVIGVALVIWQGFSSRPRFMRRKIYPRLARAIAPLRPSEQEIQAVIEELKRSTLKIAAKSKASDLISLIAEPV